MRSLITANLLIVHDNPILNKSNLVAELRRNLLTISITQAPNTPHASVFVVANARCFLPITITED